MQAVVNQQHTAGRVGTALVAHKLRRILQRHGLPVGKGYGQLTALHGIAGGIGVRSATLQGRGLIQKIAGKGDDSRTAHGVVAIAFFCAIGLGNSVRAIQRVVQTAPAGVGSV